MQVCQPQCTLSCSLKQSLVLLFIHFVRTMHLSEWRVTYGRRAFLKLQKKQLFTRRPLFVFNCTTKRNKLVLYCIRCTTLLKFSVHDRTSCEPAESAHTVAIMMSRYPKRGLRPSSQDAAELEGFLAFFNEWEQALKKKICGSGFISKSTAEGMRVTMCCTLPLLQSHLQWDSNTCRRQD